MPIQPIEVGQMYYVLSPGTDSRWCVCGPYRVLEVDPDNPTRCKLDAFGLVHCWTHAHNLYVTEALAEQAAELANRNRPVTKPVPVTRFVPYAKVGS